jgi:hypothetical protein
VSSTERSAGLQLAGRYVLQAIVASAMAVRFGGLWLFMLWPAATYLGIAYAFFTNKAELLGKRADGRFAWQSALLFLPHLVTVWLYFHAKRVLLWREAPWNEIAEGMVLGRLLLPGEMPADCNVVVDVTAELAEPRNLVEGREYYYVPTLNRFVPRSEEFRWLMETLVERKGKVYIHCGSGKGRSATVAAGLLVLRGAAKDVEEAEMMLREKRSCVRLHPVQRELIRTFCEAEVSVGAPRTLPQFDALP